MEGEKRRARRASMVTAPPCARNRRGRYGVILIVVVAVDVVVFVVVLAVVVGVGWANPSQGAALRERLRTTAHTTAG